MATVAIRHQVNDYDAWKRVYDEHGLTNVSIENRSSDHMPMRHARIRDLFRDHSKKPRQRCRSLLRPNELRSYDRLDASIVEHRGQILCAR